MIKKGAFLLIIFFFASCSSVPITGRKRVNFMSDSKVLPVSFSQYKGFLEENTLSKNKKLSNQIKEVGADLNAIAHADDGSIEAFKHKNRQVWGIVWHPERMEEAVLPSDLRSLIQ